MATTAKVAQFLFHRRIFHPLSHSTTVKFSLIHPQKLSFSLLKTHTLTHKFFTTTPLFCSVEGNDTNSLESLDNVGDFKENEEIPESKIPKMEEKEVPQLTIKEKKDLCSYANSLGDKLKSQQVGKSGVTDNVAFALNETLEANELLKLKIHKSCPGEMDDVVRQLERATGSVVVGQIGRTVIFYRPSLTKLKAEKKREHARKVVAQRREKAQAAFMNREQSPRRPGAPGRGKFGSRRSEKLAS